VLALVVCFVIFVRQGAGAALPHLREVASGGSEVVPTLRDRARITRAPPASFA